MEIKKADIVFNGKLKDRVETNSIILHCSATKEGKDYSYKDIDHWHKQRGFIGCGYNFIIERDGTIWECRPMNAVGAHCVGHNSKAIGICYIGGLDKDGKPKDTRTIEQKETLFQMVYTLMGKYNLNLEQIHCHNEFAKKDCPCFKIDKFRMEYLKWIDKRNEKN